MREHALGAKIQLRFLPKLIRFRSRSFLLESRMAIDIDAEQKAFEEVYPNCPKHDNGMFRDAFDQERFVGWLDAKDHVERLKEAAKAKFDK